MKIITNTIGGLIVGALVLLGLVGLSIGFIKGVEESE